MQQVGLRKLSPIYDLFIPFLRVPPATPSGVFALWLVLLFLYILLLPTAADTPDRGAGIPASDGHAVNVVSRHRDYASAPRR